MPHVHTRVKEKVDAVEGAELRCNVCALWKSPNAFKPRDGEHSGRATRYHATCNSCKELYNSLREKVDGILIAPTTQAVREALGSHTFVGALNQARHGGSHAPLKPLSTAAREELRERREESEGRPSMCYLVGMEGDNSAVKIGHSTNVYRRLAQYQAGNPRKLVVLALLPGGEETERALHRKFMAYHSDEYVGEWFRKSPEIMNHFAAGKVTRR